MKPKKNATRFEVIMVDAHGATVIREVVSGWRATVVRAKNLRGQHPKARTIMVVAVF